MAQEQQETIQVERLTLDLPMEAVGVILKHLDQGIHAQVRPVIDAIFQALQHAQKAAAANHRAPVVPIKPANDAKEPA